MVSRWLRGLATLALLLTTWPVCGQGMPLASPQEATCLRTPALRVAGRRFVDPAGRTVILRGVNVSGGAKVPPFLPVTNVSSLDRLRSCGFNVIRLVFVWEAFEPFAGRYDENYLAQIRAIADAAWVRGLYVIVDFHQDGFARCVSRGSGDGFPFWAVSHRASVVTPDNGPACRRWPILMATDPGMHRSFADFYADVNGTRTRYLRMLGRVAAALASSPGVIGYDVINEPWGRERTEIGPLYMDAAAAIRAVDPTAILFLEGHVTTNAGLQTRLDRPALENFVYAPHYYHPAPVVLNGWRGGTMSIDRAFAHMTAKANEWGVPLFLGEFGAPAGARRTGDYVSCLYDRLDLALGSGAQWNYSPQWNERDADGWNGEDFNILDPSGMPRANFPVRPYPRAVAGTPSWFAFRHSIPPRGEHALEFVWNHAPELGTTEIFVPRWLFPATSILEIDGRGDDVAWRLDPFDQRLIIRANRSGRIVIRLISDSASRSNRGPG
jgi:endoglycosylceramidase